MRIALGIDYDGSDFAGWQSQEGELRTVQGSVERALSTVADRHVRELCAGRTAAGVHATAQVNHFDTEAERSPRARVYGANSNLPKVVSVQWARVVDDAFHARFSAMRRRYRYVILNREVRPTFLAWRVAWEYRPLDAARMQEAAQYLIGEHDFSAYRAVACQAKSPVRTLSELTVTRERDIVFLALEANAFLHHMVRNIAGVLMDVGAGTRPVDALAAARAGADAIGLGFYAGSPRAVTIAEAQAVVRMLPPFVTTVGLFVDVVFV